MRSDKQSEWNIDMRIIGLNGFRRWPTSWSRFPAAVIITSGGPGLTLAAKAATTPIVFAPVPDPVRSGLVVSFNRPGGNITGVAA
jgi:ABC transporter substrate binding protein